MVEALAEVYRRWGPLIHRRCLALLGDEQEAKDAVHDVFVKLARGLADFRGDSELSTWIYRVATNHCLNLLRSRRARVRVDDELNTQARLLDAHVDDPSLGLERRQLLEALLTSVTPGELQVLIHCNYDGLTQAEVAQLLGISERAVRKRLGKALDALKRRQALFGLEALKHGC